MDGLAGKGQVTLAEEIDDSAAESGGVDSEDRARQEGDVLAHLLNAPEHLG